MSQSYWWWLLLFCSAVFGYVQLSDDDLSTVAEMTVPGRLEDEYLPPLLVPRVAGTPENARVRDFIVHHFQTLGWHVELDRFNDSTPLGTKSFANIIATRNPDATDRLVLAAHYDSKYFADFEFVGATDSAVPCAILMDVAESLNRILPATRSSTTLQIIFFDGEEAFVRWSDTDSTYGARHLAQKWENTRVPTSKSTIKSRTLLDNIEVLVLLDLLGTPNPRIPNYFYSTHGLFQALVSLESRLRDLNLLETQSAREKGLTLQPVFDANSIGTFRIHATSDDHIPFLKRGVHVLHIIPQPFPIEWHQPTDNAACIDQAVVRNYATLFRAFVLEYLEISPLLPKKKNLL